MYIIIYTYVYKEAIDVYKKISVKQLEDVKKYRYGCAFDDEILKSLGKEMGEYEALYLWYSDLKTKNEKRSFLVFVRNKKNGFSESGYIEGEPNDTIIREQILKAIKNIEDRKMKYESNNIKGFKGHVDNRETKLL